MRLVTPAPPVPPWTQRTEDLERIVVMLRTGLPVDRAFDDVTAVFGEGADPAEDDIPVLVERPFRLGAAAYRPRDEDLAHDLIAHIAT